MNNEEIKNIAKEIINKAQNAVLVTIDEDGFPQSRIMYTAGLDDEFKIYFVTGKSLPKCKHIKANPKINVFWTTAISTQEDWRWVSIKGTAEIRDDAEIRNRFWSDMLNRYFKGGVEDPEYVIIVISPKQIMTMTKDEYPPRIVEF